MPATGPVLPVQDEEDDRRLALLTGPLGVGVRAMRTVIRERVSAHGMADVRLVGSVARGQETRESDVDLLVDVGPGVGLVAMFRLQDELEVLLSAPVDLVPAAGLKPDVRAAVERDAVAL